MKPIDFIQKLQTMGLLDPNSQKAEDQLNDAIYVCDLVGKFGSLGPNGDLLPDHIQRIYQELSGLDQPFPNHPEPSEPVQSPRTIAASPAEPVRTGAELVPLIIDESMLPTKALDEIEEIGQAMERAFDQALDARLSRINAGDRAIAAIERRWGNDRGAA